MNKKKVKLDHKTGFGYACDPQLFVRTLSVGDIMIKA